MKNYTMFATYGLKALTGTLYIRYYNVAFLNRMFGWWGLLLLT